MSRTTTPAPHDDMRILTINCGSSSLRFRLVDMLHGGGAEGEARVLARGVTQRIGPGAEQRREGFGHGTSATVPIRDHATATRDVLEWIGLHVPLRSIDGVGYRIVHGGWRNRTSCLLDDAVLADIAAADALAPRHNAASLDAIGVCRAMLGVRLPAVAVFDTEFHASLPEVAAGYAIPDALARRHHARRLGFHGTAYRSVLAQYCDLSGTSPAAATLIALHLGGGCSAAAIRHGRSVDTSMGLTTLEGLVMGTRSGDVDPGLINYLARAEGCSAADIEGVLYRESGLLGLSGVSDDMRAVLDAAPSHAPSRRAVSTFCYRVKKYIGAYLAVLDGAQAIVFSGGIGEHAPEIRAQILQGLERFGIRLDDDLNRRVVGEAASIAAADSAIGVWVVPADEDAIVARDVETILRGAPLIEP